MRQVSQPTLAAFVSRDVPAPAAGGVSAPPVLEGVLMVLQVQLLHAREQSLLHLGHGLVVDQRADLRK